MTKPRCYDLSKTARYEMHECAGQTWIIAIPAEVELTAEELAALEVISPLPEPLPRDS